MTLNRVYENIRRLCFGVAVLFVTVALFINFGAGRASAGTIMIEPGHGTVGVSDGAYNALYNLHESDINLAIGLKLNTLLQQAGYQSFMTRSGNVVMSEDAIDSLINNSGADACISIHCNAYNGSIGGTETYYSISAPKNPADTRDHILADLVQTNLVSAIRSYPYYTSDRGVDTANFYIRNYTPPSILTEVLFIDNNYEASLLANEAFQRKVAEGIFNAIKAYVPAGSSVQFPLFSWNEVSGSTDYEIELLTQMPAQDEITSTSHSRFGIGWATTVNEFHQGDTRGMKSGTYYWRVLARDGSGNPIGLYTSAQPFYVPKPIIGQSFNGQPLSTQFPNFQWSGLQGATAYGIELLDAPPEPAEANGITASVHRIGVGVTGSTSWKGDVSGLKPGTYYYRVIAWNGAGWVGSFSDTDSFVVPKPTITAPIGGATLSSQLPIFRWSAVNGATAYGLELLRAAPTVAERNGNTASVHRIGAGLTSATSWNGDIRGMSAGTYYYRIIAANAAGLLGGFSDADSFVVPKPALNPIDYSRGQTAPYFSWNAVAGANDYGIELLSAPPENPNGVAASRYRIGAASTNRNTFFQGNTAALPSGVYYYRIIAWNNSGMMGGFSDAIPFTVNQKITVTASGGAFNITNSSGTVLAAIPAGGTVGVSYAGGIYTVVSSTGYSATTASYIRCVPVSTSTIMRVVNMPEYNRYRGGIEVRFSAASGKLWAINEVDLESYVRGMGEEPESWPGITPANYANFLQLSSIAFRSYAYDVHAQNNKHPGEPFELCNDPSSCQWYIGYERELLGQNLSTAAVATFGQVLSYQGVPVRTPYFSDCAGRTLTPGQAWGSSSYPWCVSVVDDMCVGHVQRGHGVGICMDGARVRASTGVTANAMLHYYLAVDPGFAYIANPSVRIGLFSLIAQ